MTMPDITRVRSFVDDRDLPSAAQYIRVFDPSAIAGLLETLWAKEAALVLRLLAKDEAAAVFDALGDEAQAGIISELGDTELADVFGSLPPEDQAWLLDELPARIAKRVIARFTGDELRAAQTLLGYRPGTVGRRMSSVPLRVSHDDTVDDVRERVRRSPAGSDLLPALPVITDDRRLIGTVEFVELLRRDGGERMHTLVNASIAPATTDDDAEQVARRALDHGDLIVPVVDRESRLVGVLPIADAARIDRRAVEEDHARAGASERLRRPYLFTSVFALTRARVVWLLVLAVSAILTVHVLEMFEATIEQQVALALFVPLLIGIGGNTGSQAATTVTRAIALGDVAGRDVGRVAFKEVRTGLLLGAILAMLAFAIATPFYGVAIGLVLALTLMIGCPAAATVGGVIPLIARACRVDPAVFSTPFISTFCDASGLLIYFTVAVVVLGL